ncbi:septum formation initiator family protein [Arthrobacter sp. Helios]|uniref:FtsB family cell division protein n=1 Tax=Arthrobacter sp. Helios TaxID=2828862 RepID=UPI00206AFF08|nr:septum formation initiator family protein [Arthrobacter sp. Helios]UPO77551.1 septum formation initiator family protein [Arthrobacter sp. Helios]
MSTRRPKVPKPAADGLPAGAPRRAAPKTPGVEKSRTAAAPGTGTAAAAPQAGTAASEGGAPAAKSGAGTAEGRARKPRQPKPAKTVKPESASAARAAARQELAGEIRRDVPAGTAVPAGPARTEPALKPVPAKSFSGRLLALGIVMVVITVLLAPSVRTYLQQRSEIAALQADIVEAEQTGAQLQETLNRWEDPAYIKAQARERIFLVMPGETRYLVKGEDGVEEVEEQAASETPQDLEWVDALWDSVVRSAAAP